MGKFFPAKMKTCPNSSRRPRRLSALFVVGALCLAALGQVPAATTGRKLLKMRISEDRRLAEVQVPQGYAIVTLQRYQRATGWRVFSQKTATGGQLKFSLPSQTSKDQRWRAIGRMEATSPSRGKFPARFYQGNHKFGPIKSRATAAGYPLLRDQALAQVSTDGSPPVEADIWKTDGNTVYFFNQLRGLQVLDVSNPADPRLTASLRMPMVGEDLYLLPGNGPVRHLVLLTQATTADYESITRIQLVRVEDGNIRITHSRDVTGYLADSRMIGNHLILASSVWSNGPVADRSRTLLTQWTILPDAKPRSGARFTIDGDGSLIAAGSDWLAVPAWPNGVWNHSEVTVFGIRDGVLQLLTARPLPCSGVIADSYKIQWNDGILTTISENFSTDWNNGPVTGSILATNRPSWAPRSSVQARSKKAVSFENPVAISNTTGSERFARTWGRFVRWNEPVCMSTSISHACTTSRK